jgi:hypothetical protein
MLLPGEITMGGKRRMKRLWWSMVVEVIEDRAARVELPAAITDAPLPQNYLQARTALERCD